MNFEGFAMSAAALVGRTHCRLAWLTAIVATAIAIGQIDTAAAGSFSLDDNPSSPIFSPPGVPGGPVTFGSHDNVDAYDHSTQVPGPVPALGLYTVSSYFAVSPDEALAVAVIAADIFDVPALAPGTASVPFAASLTMGLDLAGGFNSDSIDALVMFDGNLIGGPANGGPGAEPLLDFALFSSAPGSVSLFLLGLSADDLFFTDFSGALATYVRGTDIGLFPGPGGTASLAHFVRTHDSTHRKVPRRHPNNLESRY